MVKLKFLGDEYRCLGMYCKKNEIVEVEEEKADQLFLDFPTLWEVIERSASQKKVLEKTKTISVEDIPKIKIKDLSKLKIKKKRKYKRRKKKE